MAFTPKSLQLSGFDKVGFGGSSNPFPATGFYFTADDSTVYLVTIDHTIPDWVFTPVAPPSGTTGSPMGTGWLMFITYPS